MALAEDLELDRIIVGDVDEAVEQHEVVAEAEACGFISDECCLWGSLGSRRNGRSAGAWDLAAGTVRMSLMSWDSLGLEMAPIWSWLGLRSVRGGASDALLPSEKSWRLDMASGLPMDLPGR